MKAIIKGTIAIGGLILTGVFVHRMYAIGLAWKMQQDRLRK